MKEPVLVIGSGGREHAIAWSLSKSAHASEVFCLPGNAGMEQVATVVPIKPSDHNAVLNFIETNQVKLTVIGPEIPLVEGLSDFLRAKGHRVVGASQKAAQLEGSKIFAKNFMAKYDIPTAAFKIFDNARDAKAFARSPEGRAFRVLKADGLAAGKGVIIAKTTEEMLAAIAHVMEEKKFGDAGSKILLEEMLEGPEVSLMALTDGKTVLPFPASQDHKRVNDGDKGPNTGGMGAYAPTRFYDDLTRVTVERDVIQNFVRGVSGEGLDFRGIIYFGLMLTKRGPMVLEFNVRLGDPEAQAILPLIDSDMVELFTAVAEGKLAHTRMQIKAASCCNVVLASKGYPNEFQTGFPISGLDEAQREGHIMVFHAGTKKSESGFVTNGGRVLNVTGMGKSLESAVVRAYQGVKKIKFRRMHFRNDIAAKAFFNKTIKSRIKKMKTRHAQETALLGA